MMAELAVMAASIGGLLLWAGAAYRARRRRDRQAARLRATDIRTLHPGATALWDAELAGRGKDPFQGWLLPSGRVVQGRHWVRLDGVSADIAEHDR